MSLPVLYLHGSPYDQGFQHGSALKDRIARNLRIYFERFEREVGLPRAQVLAWSTRYADAIAGQNPDYHAALRGVADGSGAAFGDIAALNVRYEILYYQFGKNATALASDAVDGCTAFAVLPEASADGHLLLGQNWDWIPQVRGAILHTTEADGLQTAAFTEAGIVGAKIGLNSAGVGLAINGMTTTDDDWARLSRPFHVRCYEILRARDFDQAVGVVTNEARACSTNFLIAQAPGRAADIEAAPDAVSLLRPRNGLLVHANHFLDPRALGVEEPPNPRRVFSCHRNDRLGALLDSRRPVTREAAEECLRDHDEHPMGVCRHAEPDAPPEQQYVTVTSVVMDLHARTLRVTDGPPCRSEYQTVELAA